jgi:predicted hydrocarbon binding protein
MYREFLIAYIKNCNDFILNANGPILYRSGEDVATSLSGKSLDEIKNLTDFEYEISAERITFTVRDSIETESFEKSDKPICCMLQGFFAEISKNIFKLKKTGCKEVKCRAKGDKECVFEVEAK